MTLTLAEMVTKNFLKYLEKIGLTRNILKVQQKAVTLQTSYSMQIPRPHPLTVNFLPLTEPNPNDNLGQAKAFQQLDAEKCD